MKMVESASQESGKRQVDQIMTSIAKRRHTSVFGSRRWWQGGCWATKSHQEAYLRKLYSRKYPNGLQSRLGEDNNDSANSPWKPAIYDLPTNDEHYLDSFLRGRSENDNGCPALSTPRASPTEKCVEFLIRNNAPDPCHHQNFHMEENEEPLRITERNLDNLLRAEYGSNLE